MGSAPKLSQCIPNMVLKCSTYSPDLEGAHCASGSSSPPPWQMMVWNHMFRGTAEGFSTVIAGKSYTHNLHATDFSVQIVPTSSSALGHIFWPSGGRGHMPIQPHPTGGLYY